MKPTFKNHYPEGRYRSFDHIHSDIKFGTAQVGSILYDRKSNSMRVLLHVRDGGGFKNVILKKEFPVNTNERAAIRYAKEWIKEVWTVITGRYELYSLE